MSEPLVDILAFPHSDVLSLQVLDDCVALFKAMIFKLYDIQKSTP